MDAKPKTTLERALAILDHCSQHAGGTAFSTLREVCGGVAGMTLTRILTPLQESGHLVKDEDGLYRLGSAYLASARAALGQASFEETIQPVVDRLAHATGQAAAYFQWDGDWIYLRLKSEQPNAFRYAEIGARNHPVGHTFFRPVQAFLPVKSRKHLDVEGDARLLTKIRKDGIYHQVEKYRYAIYRIVAPVFAGEGGPVCGSMGITSLILDYTPEELDRFSATVRQHAELAIQRISIKESPYA